MASPLPHRLAVFASLLRRRARNVGFPLFAGLCVLVAARYFYFEMLTATGGEWSAPLDDVFIHFDYARATARGFPFQWSEGNGFSSGNTSLTYPFALALGYWGGFRGPNLMLWAAIVACSSVFAFLLAVRRLASRLPAAAAFLIPPCVLCIGALCWSFFSGMEVAFFLGLWAVALVLALHHRSTPSTTLPALGWQLGIAGALVTATRPEGSTSVAILGITAALFVWRSHRSLPTSLATLLRAGVPAIAFLTLQAVVNLLLTGESSAAGAIVKLALNNPFMTVQEKWDEYIFLLKYCTLRNFEHHFTTPDGSLYGWIPLILALIALLSKRTRGPAVLLLSSCLFFILLVALNGQVRWQNERYTMPAVAWLLTASALGLGVLLSRTQRTFAQTASWLPRIALGVALASAFIVHELPNINDQVWFFARACRNIRDQHIVAGRLLRSEFEPTPKRLLVGDAGALIYASDLPGLDIIGLGGYRGLPFARASVHGIGATVELIERIAPADRPDAMALYPTWWGHFPVWFGKHITSVWVQGNVICGGAEKAIYRADWHLLGTGSSPATLAPGESIVDELDPADLVSEDQHAYTSFGGLGDPARPCKWPSSVCRSSAVDMRILADPVHLQKDIFDAGRRVIEGRTESFELLAPADAPQALRLILRAAPPRTAGVVQVTVDGTVLGTLPLVSTGGFNEMSIALPESKPTRRRLRVALTPSGTTDWVDYHVWLVGNR